MSREVIMMRGLPASGKSTWALEQLAKYPGRYTRINKDDLRRMAHGRHSDHNEQHILAMRDALILLALEQGTHVIVDDTNYHSKHESRIRELVKGKVVVRIQDFSDVSPETCCERNIGRPHPVREQVIWDMYYRYIWKPVPAPEYTLLLPTCLIVDLDGTLALHAGRSPYDTAKCEQDALNQPVAWAIHRAINEGWIILLLSGREDTYRPQTERWLSAHDIRFDALYMRPAEDKRRDYVVKEELYRAHIEGQYNVGLVLDDRSSVVRLWRSLGLPCWQVAYGDF